MKIPLFFSKLHVYLLSVIGQAPNVRGWIFNNTKRTEKTMLQTIAINNTLAAINDNITQGFAAHDLGDEEEKLAHARAAFLLIGEIREIADCSQGALDLQTFFDAVAAYENATRALMELLLA